MGQAVKCVKIQLKEEEISGPDCSVFWADSESWTLCLTPLVWRDQDVLAGSCPCVSG